MDLSELLEKEQELRKRNQILSQTCAMVVSKVEKDVMNSHEILNKPVKLVTTESTISTAAENDDGPAQATMKPSDWTSKNDKINVQKVLTAKINVLQKEIDHSLQNLSEKETVIKELQGEIKLLQDQDKKNAKHLAATKINYEKSASTILDLKKSKMDLESRIQEMQKELDTAHRDRKNAVAEGNAKEARLNRAMQENEKLKNLLSKASSQVKETAGSYKSRFDSLFIENQRLVKQKSDLLLAFKKQMQLIEVLKKQKMHLESVGLLGFTEEEFIKLITSNVKESTQHIA
jgi:hypothetical protein